MNRTLRAVVAVAALGAAASGGFLAARPDLWPFKPTNATVLAPVAAQTTAETAAVIYYQDPDGRPSYSLTPMKAADGRDFRPVLASQDLSFDDDVKPTMAQSHKIKFYRNPMGLPDTSPTPKKDSMGMDYIPVFEDDDTNDGSVKLSIGKIQRTGVKSEPAAKRVIRTIVRAPGTIALDERRISVIAMRSESFVLKVADVTTGSHVDKGQHLMTIYSPAITSASAEYLATLNSRTGTGVDPYGRGSRQRLMNLDLPDEAIAAIEKSRTVPTSIEWTAPRDGVVLERNATESMRVQPGGVLFRIADHSRVWALIDVAERDLGAISVSQIATVRARSYPGRTFTGKIGVIYPEINKDTRTARVRIDLANPDLALLHDMYVDAEIDTGSGDPVLSVPESAVMDTGSRQAVFIDKGQGRFEPHDVKLGQRGAGYVEIREGISEGDLVVVAANFLIDAESNLRAAMKSYGDAGSPQ